MYINFQHNWVSRSVKNREYILYLRLLRNIYCNHINLFPTIINIVLNHLHTCIWDLSYSLYYDDILLHFTVHVELYISILFARFLLIRILICMKLPYNAADFIVLLHDHLNQDLTIYHATLSNCSSFESNQCYHFRRYHFLQSYTTINLVSYTGNVMYYFHNHICYRGAEIIIKLFQLTFYPGR